MTAFDSLTLACENAAALGDSHSKDSRMIYARDRMKRFVEGHDRGQTTLFPECLEDCVNRHPIGTPDRHPKRTPLFYVLSD